MSRQTFKWLSLSLMTVSAFMWGCSESDTSGPVVSENQGVYLKNEATQMWARIDARGSIADYFDSVSQSGKTPIIDVSTRINGHCEAPALAMDDNTRFLDELESLFDEGEQIEGVCGKGLKLNDGQVAPLGVNLIDSMKVGTVEFWFRPNEDFYDKDARTLLGNDGARIHFFYKNGELYFQKNHHNQHFFVNGTANLKKDWNLIAGQWGDGYMSLWLNGELVGYWKHSMGYAPAQRGIPFENLVVIGYKSRCCMEGPGQYESMTTSGSFDQFRISNIARYSLPDSIVAAKGDQKDSTSISSSSSSTPKSSSSAIEPPVVADTAIVDTTAKNDSLLQEPLWKSLDRWGVTGYFKKYTAPTASVPVKNCKAPALAMDDNALYLDELEAIYREGELVEGVCGKALSLKDGEVAPSGINLIDNMKSGTVEFWFRPNEDFFSKSARTLLGNDGARVHFFVKDSNLIFQKNHADQHFFVKAPVKFKDGWNLIAGQWDNGTMSLWLNNELLASVDSVSGYEAAAREIPYENLIVIGYKSSCCMEGPGQKESMTTSGAYDQLRISNVARYSKKEDSGDTVVADTLPPLKPIADTLSKENVAVKDSGAVVEQPKIEADTSAQKDSVRVADPAKK